MKRALPDHGDRDEIKKIKVISNVRHVPRDVPINIREMSREQFFKADTAVTTEPNVLRSLLRLCARAKSIHHSNELAVCYSQLEQISASRFPDAEKINDIRKRLETMGIHLNSFVPRDKTEKDYDEYLSETAEEKMNIRKLLRLT